MSDFFGSSVIWRSPFSLASVHHRILCCRQRAKCLANLRSRRSGVLAYWQSRMPARFRPREVTPLVLTALLSRPFFSRKIPAYQRENLVAPAPPNGTLPRLGFPPFQL